MSTPTPTTKKQPTAEPPYELPQFDIKNHENYWAWFILILGLGALGLFIGVLASGGNALVLGSVIGSALGFFIIASFGFIILRLIEATQQNTIATLTLIQIIYYNRRHRPSPPDTPKAP